MHRCFLAAFEGMELFLALGAELKPAPCALPQVSFFIDLSRRIAVGLRAPTEISHLVDGLANGEDDDLLDQIGVNADRLKVSLRDSRCARLISRFVEGWTDQLINGAILDKYLGVALDAARAESMATCSEKLHVFHCLWNRETDHTRQWFSLSSDQGGSMQLIKEQL